MSATKQNTTQPPKGVLYLIPNTLGIYGAEGAQDTLTQVLPAHVLVVMQPCQYFVVETPKVARQFLKAVGTTAPLQELHISELNVKTADSEVKSLLAPLLVGHDLGLISDAGCPAVADPGARLVEMAHQHDIRVVPLVGPSSILLALMASGLNGQKFAFQGYLPIDAQQRTKEIKRLEQESKTQKQTQLFIETPYRNMQLFETLLNTLQPNTQLCVAADLTLPSERIQMRRVRDWQQYLQKGNTIELHKRPCIFLYLA